MDERDFELLAVLKKTKNITHAAELLYISQSSLSKRICAMEKELGTTLMLRSRQGIHFTAEGETVLQHTEAAAGNLQRMRDALATSQGCICGTLEAAISINYAMYTLPAVLERYHYLYPQARAHITTGQSPKLYMHLLEGDADVAVMRGEYSWQGEKILLSSEPICLICHEKDKDVPLSELPYIGRKTDSVFERELARWMHENNLQPDLNGAFVDNITICVEMVKRGLGWAVLPSICLNGFSGIVKPLVFADGRAFTRPTHIFYTEESASLPQVRAFIEVVRDIANKKQENEP